MLLQSWTTQIQLLQFLGMTQSWTEPMTLRTVSEHPTTTPPLLFFLFALYKQFVLKFWKLSSLLLFWNLLFCFYLLLVLLEMVPVSNIVQGTILIFPTIMQNISVRQVRTHLIEMNRFAFALTKSYICAEVRSASLLYFFIQLF